eukprot:363330-Chlamydomonas_euryale.AAC.25
MSEYRYGSNWTRSGGGGFENGRGEPIRNPGPYFDAVASNTHGYNASYSNGHGKPIHNPPAYFNAVSNDRYGYAANAPTGKK